MFQAMISDRDTVISNSWSQCEDQTPIADARAIDSVLASAAASGITTVNGSGDHGSTCLDGTRDTVGVPADSPHAMIGRYVVRFAALGYVTVLLALPVGYVFYRTFRHGFWPAWPSMSEYSAKV